MSRGGSYQTPQLVPIDANLSEGGGNPAIDPNNRMLVFVSARPGGAGNSDLWPACRSRNGWAPAQNLGAKVNSAFADFAPSFSDDGRVLSFTSERPGIVGPRPEGTRPPGDLYQINVTALPVHCE